MVVKKTGKKILFLDSGIGGLTLLCESCREYPTLDYKYFADYKNMPYGSKSAETLRLHLLQIISELQCKFKFDTVVLACNTATSVAIDFLRQKFQNVNFIGTEPAVSLASKEGYKNILVLATENTIKHNKTLKRYSLNPDLNLYLQPMLNLAQSIEINMQNLGVCMSQIMPILTQYQGKVDCVVLGCTHYSMLKNLLMRYFKVPVLDGNSGVIRHLGNFVKQTKKRGKVTLLTNDSKKITQLQDTWLLLNKKEGL